MSDLFSPDFLFRNAILGGLGVALLCAVLGVHLVLRRLVLIGVALPQASAAGIAAVFWLTRHAHVTEGSTHELALAASLAATFLALLFLVAGRWRGGSAPAEWSAGALYAVTSTATILFVAVNPTGDLEMSNLLRGELLAMTERDLGVIGAVTGGVGALLVLFRRELLLASFDPEFAQTIGLRPWRYDLLLYALLGGGIALGVMTAGPLVVFGFLVLPALAALRVAPGVASAFAIAVGLAAASFLGGFAIAYRADLPAGPTGVAVAALLWLLVALFARLRTRAWRGVAMLALIAGSLAGCAREPRPLAALAPGSLPAAAAEHPIAVLPFANATGQDLFVPDANPLRDLRRAAGDPFAPRPADVPGVLQQRAMLELERRGFAVTPLETVRAAVASASDDAPTAARLARRGGLDGSVLHGRLERFTITGNGLLLVRLDLTLMDAASDRVLWTGAATRPVPIGAALSYGEVLLDAGGPIFADAFGN